MLYFIRSSLSRVWLSGEVFSPPQSPDLSLAPNSLRRTCRVQTLWSMSDWTAGEAMGTLTRLHATAALAPQVWGLQEEASWGAAESQRPADRAPLCGAPRLALAPCWWSGQCQRAQGGVQDKRAQRPRGSAARASSCAQWDRNTHTERRSSGSGGREMEGSGGSKSEGAGDGPLQPPAGPSSGNTHSLMSLIVCWAP